MYSGSDAAQDRAQVRGRRPRGFAVDDVGDERRVSVVSPVQQATAAPTCGQRVIAASISANSIRWPAQLDLLVETAEELDRAVVAPARPVAGAIQAPWEQRADRPLDEAVAVGSAGLR